MSNKNLMYNWQSAKEAVWNPSFSSSMPFLSDLYARYRAERSYFGYDPSVLKSGLQKYARRAELDKGLWCLIEMDLFSLIELEGPALNQYLYAHPKETRKNTQANARRLRTNLVNRLVVIMSEEVNIAAWWMPSISRCSEMHLDSRRVPPH